MKIKIEEYEECFAIKIEPETVKDVSILARLKINARKEVRSIDVSFYKDGIASGWVIFPKNRRSRCSIK